MIKMIDTPMIDEFLKGGPGSGIKGHRTSKATITKRNKIRQKHDKFTSEVEKFFGMKADMDVITFGEKENRSEVLLDTKIKNITQSAKHKRNQEIDQKITDFNASHKGMNAALKRQDNTTYISVNVNW